MTSVAVGGDIGNKTQLYISGVWEDAALFDGCGVCAGCEVSEGRSLGP